MRRKTWWILAFLAPWGAASGETVTLEPSPLQFPVEIGPLRLKGEPYRYEPAGLGISYQYTGNGISLTVYVYDAGLRDIPDSGETPEACVETEQAKAGVLQGDYQQIHLVSEQLARLGTSDWPVAREAYFEFKRFDLPTLSYVWVTAAAKHFIKLRFTLDARLRDEVPEARRAILDALGTAMAPHLASRAGEVEKSDVSMNLVMDGNELESSLLYLSMLSTLAENSPTLAPLCGGDLVPDYATELGAYQGLVAMQGEDRSRLGKQLVAVSDAGFLEEFVWAELHREAWGDDPPAGLDVDGYSRWRKKHLKRFRTPVLGGLYFRSPRTLPVEPAPTP